MIVTHIGGDLAILLRRVVWPRSTDERVAKDVALAVASWAERRTLLTNPSEVMGRLEYAARDRGVSFKRVIQDIRGAGTAVGIVLRDARAFLDTKSAEPFANATSGGVPAGSGRH